MWATIGGRETENNTEKKKRKGLFATCVVSLSQLRLDNDFFSASRRPIFCVIFPERVAIARCDLKKIGKKFVLFFWCWCRNIGDRKSFSRIPNAKSGSKQTYCLPRECPAENDPRLPRPHFLLLSPLLLFIRVLVIHILGVLIRLFCSDGRSDVCPPSSCNGSPEKRTENVLSRTNEKGEIRRLAQDKTQKRLMLPLMQSCTCSL